MLQYWNKIARGGPLGEHGDSADSASGCIFPFVLIMGSLIGGTIFLEKLL